MNFTEKRKMERFSLNLPALITIIDERVNQQVFNVMSSNICSGGSYFKTDEPLSVGTDVKVELILTFDKLKKFGVKRSHVVAFGSIIRTNDQGMAVCFGKKFHISPLIGVNFLMIYISPNAGLTKTGESTKEIIQRSSLDLA